MSEPENLIDLMKKDISYVLIDLRPAKEAEASHINGAVSVPLADLNAAKTDLPADKTAPIILYGTGADEAFKTVREWGYKNTTVLNGGPGAFKEKGGEVLTGALERKINYVFKPRPGEILVEEFKQVVASKPKDKFILDVRDEDEAMRGMLVGAVNIPADKLKDRLSELPKDKEIILHCVTGIRAEMAHGILKENGFKSRFLNAVIQIDPDGKYEIAEK